MKEECLICKAPLEYLKEDMEMECELCHKKEKSKTRCVNGHYVCNECHMQGIDSLVGICMEEKSDNPVIILNKMMSQPFCHMHGPEHHIMVGSGQRSAVPTAAGIISALGSAVPFARRKRRLLLSVSTILAEARLRKRLENSICPISVTVIPPGQRSDRRSIRMR